MLRFLPFAQEHVQHIKLMFDLSEEGRKALVEHKDIRGYTLFEEDVVLGIGGVHNIWQGVGEAWLLLGKEAFARPITVARHTCNMFDHMQEEYKYQRIQASIAVKDVKAKRFAEWLDFENEGIMRKYGPDGSDYYRYARVM
ncbi:MAG: hypothetical protein CMF11_09030 [Idiomarina sp.]|nr:hypothetical protein [Idiomarina sp.]